MVEWLCFFKFLDYGLILEIGAQSYLNPAIQPSQLYFVLLHNYPLYLSLPGLNWNW